MMRRLYTAFAAAVVPLLALALVSCDGSDDSKDENPEKIALGECPLPAGPLAVALSRRANSPGDLPNEVGQIVQNFINDIPAEVHGPRLSLLNVDGRPDVQREAQFFSDSKNSLGREDDQENFLNGFFTTTTEMRADEPEVDVLDALEEAGGVAGRPGAGTVVLVDSGLSTSGALDFTRPGVLDAPADDLIPFLRATGALPDLSGLTVVLVGIGDVAMPQQKLGARKKHLVEVWKKIAKASGAACVTAVEVPRTDKPVEGEVQPVTLVPVPAPPVYKPGEVLVLPDVGEMGFEPGQAVFRDPVAARKVLEPIAKGLQAGHSHRLLLTGTTARWGTRDYQMDLALRRAMAVKQELVRLGADQSQIETRGLGSYFAQYIPDNGPGGILIPGPAQANRTVRVEPCESTCASDSPGPP